MNRKLRRAAATGKQRRSVSQGDDVAPDFLGGFLSHGWQLLAEGRDEEAMEIAARAVAMGKTDESKALFVQCVKSWTYFPGAEKIRDVLAIALRESWGKTSDLIGLTRGLLDRDPVIGPAMRRASDAWPRRLPLAELLEERGLGAVANDPLLLAILESSKFVGIDLERFLTSIRAGLLDMAIDGGAAHDGEGPVSLCCALARQCYITEYIFDLSLNERDQLNRLRDRVRTAIASKGKILPFDLAVLGAYESLDCLPEREALLKRSWPEGVSDLLNQQIREPAIERRYRDSISKITAIADGTSVSVRQQYEDNPYPRWHNIHTGAPPVPIDELIARDYPFSNYRKMDKTGDLDILVAGCGTGYHSILFARSLPGAKMLAIDLSLSSLCYAKRKTLELGLTHIDYAQGDILELGTLGRTFDVITSSGVLHHLADPEQGWSTLLSLLRPNGCMHIGLYSEFARQKLAAAQNWLRTRDYGTTIEDIRRARQDLIAATASEPIFNDVLNYPDFFTASECRDLLFHSQEQSFTIPRIHAFIERNGLRFLGFQIDAVFRDQFADRFSREREADLMLWHEFEIENPDIFRGMYQFLVQTA